MTHSSFGQYLLCSLLFACLCGPAHAEKTALPLKLDGVDTVNAETLIALAQGLDDLVVVDSRLSEDHWLGFIGGSHSLPDINTNCTTLARITSDKNRSMVFYSNGTECTRSVQALKIARQCGYNQLYWFRGGFEEWRNKDYPYLLE